MSPFQAKPDASETCNYSWLPPPAAIAPVPFQDTSWPCLAFCLRNPKPVDQAHLPIEGEKKKKNSKAKKQYNEVPPSRPPQSPPPSQQGGRAWQRRGRKGLRLSCMADKARRGLRPQPLLCPPLGPYLLLPWPRAGDGRQEQSFFPHMRSPACAKYLT